MRELDVELLAFDHDRAQEALGREDTLHLKKGQLIGMLLHEKEILHWCDFAELCCQLLLGNSFAEIPNKKSDHF